MWAIGEPNGPIENGMTYIVRPRIAPVYSSLELPAHLAGIAPVVRRAGVGLALGADERAVLDAGDVGRVGMGPEAVRTLVRIERGERASGDEIGAQLGVLLRRTVAPVDAVGLEDRRPVRRPIVRSLSLLV